MMPLCNKPTKLFFNGGEQVNATGDNQNYFRLLVGFRDKFAWVLAAFRDKFAWVLAAFRDKFDTRSSR